MKKHKQRLWKRWIASGPVFKEGGQGRLYIVKDTKGEFEGEYVLKELKNPKRLNRFNSELQAIGRGIVQGSTHDIIMHLTNREWDNLVLKALLDVMKEADEKQETSNN